VAAAFRRAIEPLKREAGHNPYLLQEELQQVMGRHVGIVRTADELQQGIEALAELQEKLLTVRAEGASQYNPAWHQALSIRSLVVVAEAVARAARIREESRGAHTRIDFEGERDEWLRYNIVTRRAADGMMETLKVERPAPPEELARIAGASIDDLEREVAGDRNVAAGREGADG
jgi:succinate dehydrogenase / fumarate reductase flavoprotein subunit